MVEYMNEKKLIFYLFATIYMLSLMFTINSPPSQFIDSLIVAEALALSGFIITSLLLKYKKH